MWLAMVTRQVKKTFSNLKSGFSTFFHFQASFEAEVEQLEINKRVADFVVKKIKEKAKEEQRAGQFPNDGKTVFSLC